MAENEGESSNSVFQELADWEDQLKALGDDIPRDFGGLEP
jgi:hypothetical protein